MRPLPALRRLLCGEHPGEKIRPCNRAWTISSVRPDEHLGLDQIPGIDRVPLLTPRIDGTLLALVHVERIALIADEQTGWRTARDRTACPEGRLFGPPPVPLTVRSQDRRGRSGNRALRDSRRVGVAATRDNARRRRDSPHGPRCGRRERSTVSASSS